MNNQTIHLKALSRSDARQLARIANNKNIWDNLRDFFPHPYHEEDAIFFIELSAKEAPRQKFGIYSGEMLCGVAGVVLQSDVYRKSGEMGYWIGESYWGNGIGTKEVELITNYAFDRLDLTRVYASIFEYNVASMRVLEKNGFQLEGISKSAVFKNGQFFNEHRYAKLKSRSIVDEGGR